MQFSIKSPSALLWKTGYTEEAIKGDVQAGRVAGDWLVCPLGDAAKAVTIAEFIANPSILKASNDAPGGRTPGLTDASQAPLSAAALGWRVFFGALIAHFFVTLILANRGGEVAINRGGDVFTATILEGTNAMVIAGAIIALLGHAYPKLMSSNLAGGGQSATRSRTEPASGDIPQA